MSGAEEYRSAPCAIGRHGECGDFPARESGVPGLRHLVCGCGCHPADEGRVTAPAGEAAEGVGERWYRLCWTLRPEAPRAVAGVEYGVLVGRDVPAILRGMRGCLPPPAYHDPVHVRVLADTPGGWSYESRAVSAHTHRIAGPEEWAALFACPGRERAGDGT
ncbi:hypothetical protein CUT44_11435 [Streptomyces carminius]|uniref:Uncharacterized protein n=1 Tax=Streptomyces carminius TaxID=2665496 RepID=A0A2M8LYJ4_9ACTN|nr:hypothetical protein [Streptomyces carminius]PJE97021.1 hypothetical protein CUT44_14690 [Streptomyces carminius]PJE97730.1 hypothetical protein CUT44_11435 [Streptomyces carminius]